MFAVDGLYRWLDRIGGHRRDYAYLFRDTSAVPDTNLRENAHKYVIPAPPTEVKYAQSDVSESSR
jgi:hypothetical protein